MVERGRRVGGVSVHTGTIPSKTLRETALDLSGWRKRGFYGRSYRVKQDISAEDLRARLHIALNHEIEVLEHQFARNRVTTPKGDARFTGKIGIDVEGEAGETFHFSADKFLIADGTKPFRPDYIPFDGKYVLDSDEILYITELPRSIAVTGAGVIGIEYATIFSALDAHVTLIEPRDTMLDFIDNELVADLKHELRDTVIVLRFGSKVEKVVNGGECRCETHLEGALHSVQRCAFCRRPNGCNGESQSGVLRPFQ